MLRFVLWVQLVIEGQREATGHISIHIEDRRCNASDLFLNLRLGDIDTALADAAKVFEKVGHGGTDLCGMFRPCVVLKNAFEPGRWLVRQDDFRGCAAHQRQAAPTCETQVAGTYS